MSSDPDLSAALTRIRAAGVTLAVRDGNLAVQTRRPLTAAQAGFLRANKTALICFDLSTISTDVCCSSSSFIF
jgi:hypothetical protein